MNDKYKQLLNIYDEDNLRINIDGAAYYILLFEAFKDMVDSCVKFFYQTEEIVDGKLICRISKEYRIDVSSKSIKKPMANSVEMNSIHSWFGWKIGESLKREI